MWSCDYYCPRWGTWWSCLARAFCQLLAELLEDQKDHINLSVYPLSRRWTWKSEKCSLKNSVDLVVVSMTFLFSNCNCSSLFAVELILPLLWPWVHDCFKILAKGNEPKSLSSLEVFNTKRKYWRGLSAQAIPPGFMHLIINVPAALSASPHHDFSPVLSRK